MFRVHLRKMHLLLLGGVFCMSVRYNWFIVLFKFSVSFLIFCLVVSYVYMCIYVYIYLKLQIKRA